MDQDKLCIDSIFFAALQRGAAEDRAAYLDNACGADHLLRQRVERLLAAQPKVSNFLESPAPGLSTPTSTPDELAVSERPGTIIGPYKLLQQIGEGGMGTVFMAEQTHPVQRKVALKIIKPGMDSRQVIARFEAERQALALMDHPNIARVLDAGTTAGTPSGEPSGEPGGVSPGRPYFVMELVKGVPITRFCDEHHLTLRERLELFVPVCQAVQHAHQKGIIHRDLKPSNVLVCLYDDRPVAKVIDFGLAKAAGPKLTEKTLFTEFGAVVGTLEYMSPEQAKLNQLDVDTRSDIYSLGVLLYQLLTGTTPLERKRLQETAFLEAPRLIREEEPPRPSTRLSTTEDLPAIAANRGLEPKKLRGLVRGELDWIVMKALEKDRNRRYETPNGLALDIQRYLTGEMVLAGPDRASYRLGKFVRRHRAPVLTAILVLLVLVAGIIGTSWALVRVSEAESLATSRAAAEQTAREKADEARREAVANLKTACQAVDQMLTRVADEKLAETPQMESVRKGLLEDALNFYQGLLPKSSDPALRLETGRVWKRVGSINLYFDQYDEALRALRESIKVLEGLIADFPTEPQYRAALAQSYLALGDNLCLNFGQNQEAEIILRRALLLFEELTAERPESFDNREGQIRVRGVLARTLENRGQTRAAEEEYRRGMALAGDLVVRFPTRPVTAELQGGFMLRLGLMIVLSNPPEAEKLFRQALALLTRALAENPNSQVNRFYASWSQQSLAKLLQDSGRLTEAEENYRQAIALCEQVVADFPNRLNYQSALCEYQLEIGELLEIMKRPKEAEQAYRRAWASADKVRPEDQPPYFWFQRLDRSHNRLIKLLTAAGRRQEVEAHYRKALVLWDKLAAQSPAVAEYRVKRTDTSVRLGRLLAQQGRLADAITVYQKAIRQNPDAATPYNNLAWLLATCPEADLRDPKKALELAQKAVTLEPKTATFWNTLGAAQYRAGDLRTAIATLHKSINLASNGNSADFFFLAMAHYQLGAPAEARKYYDQALVWMEKNLPKDEDLRRLRVEASKLLGVPDDWKPKKA